MDIEEKIKAEAAKARAKLAKIKKWPARLEKLKSRKDNILREAAFCRKYDLNISRFNRYKNMKEAGLPSDSLLDKIENAFKSEGV